MPNAIIDNSGDGNCLYYSYGISLIYFLREKQNPVITEAVLNRLHLEEEEKNRLKNLVTRYIPIQEKDIKTVIEPILGKALRQLASKKIKQEFIDKPRAANDLNLRSKIQGDM